MSDLAPTAIVPGWAIVGVVDPDPVAERCAVISSSSPSTCFGEGKFWTLVATYVAMEMPPAVTYSTRWYVLPTCFPVSRSSDTESMTLLEPVHWKVATTVLPRGGFSGLNSLLSSAPLWGIVPLCPHNARPDAVTSARSPGVPALRLGGVTASEQPAASRATARSRLNVALPPYGERATSRRPQSSRRAWRR